MAPEIRDPKASELAKAISGAAREGIASVEAAVPSVRFAGIELQKGKASEGELLSIADQKATYVTRPYIDHGSLLYDETGLPISDEPPFNPTTVPSQLRKLGLQTPSEATGIVREDRDRR